MEIAPGYKKTELGVIPCDWNITSIGNVATKVGSGITPKGGSSNYREYGRPFVRSQNIGWGTLLLDDLVFITDETHSSFSATELKDGDVLLNITGASIGRSALSDSRLVGGNVNQHVCIIRLNQSETDSRFINYFLLSSLGQSQIDSFQAGGNREGLNFGQIRSIRMLLPPTKAEQEAIAEALSDADALIDSMEKLIAKKRLLKQGVMAELLTGRRRLPGFTSKWETKMLGEVAPLQRGFDLPTSNIQQGSYPIVYSNGVLNYHSKFQVKGPGVVTGRSGTIGKVTFVSQNYWPHNTSLWVTSFKDNEPKFVYYLYVSIGLERFATGSGVPTLNRNDVHAFNVTMPSQKEEQEAIAKVLNSLDAEISALEAKLDKGRLLKQGMMHRLLTGKIRLI